MKPYLIFFAICTPLVAAEWKLVWQDEFNGSGSPDPAKWSYEEGYIRNREAQLYTRRTENVRMENGVLVIEARKEALRNPAYEAGSTSWQKRAEYSQYTSGGVRTLGRKLWKYG